MTPNPDTTESFPPVDATLVMPVVAEDTAVMPVVPAPEPEPETLTLVPLPEPEPEPYAYEHADYEHANALFMSGLDDHLARVRAEWDQRIGPVDGDRAGTERRRISDELDAGMLGCRRIAAQAAAALYGTARTPASHRGGEILSFPSPAWAAPQPAIEGLPRHSHRRGGA